MSDPLYVPSNTTTYLQLQLPVDVIEQDFPEVPAIREMIAKVDLAAKGDVATELVPPREARLDRLLQSL